jgi:hypothetical protein
MSVTAREASDQAGALAAAAKDSPVRQVRYELATSADEWRRAAALVAGAEGEAVIELLGAVRPGMRVFVGEGGFARVIRKTSGGLTLHVEDEFSPQGRYWNFQSDASPVVVRA